MNEGIWIEVTLFGTGKRVAINLRHVISVTENSREEVYNGERSTIKLVDGKERSVYESYDEISKQIYEQLDDYSHGNWILETETSEDGLLSKHWYRCSACGRASAIASHYCQHCGTRMTATRQER